MACNIPVSLQIDLNCHSKGELRLKPYASFLRFESFVPYSYTAKPETAQKKDAIDGNITIPLLKKPIRAKLKKREM